MPVHYDWPSVRGGGHQRRRDACPRASCRLLESRIIDEVAHRPSCLRGGRSRGRQPGSLLARLLVALGSASTEPAIPPEAAAWQSRPTPDPAFDTRKAGAGDHPARESGGGATGNVVIVGEAALHPSRFPRALHVFLRAATDFRVKAIMARNNIASEEEARKRLKRTDENWTAYIKQVYGHDRNLAAHYDLVRTPAAGLQGHGCNDRRRSKKPRLTANPYA